MKELTVRRIVALEVKPEEVADLLDRAGVEFQSIGTVNWPDYPYAPEAAFRIAHTGDSILLQYKVRERTSRARYGEDRGDVWTDSCVEFFCSPAGDGLYYNLETNCIGTLLLCCGVGRKGREYAPEEVERSVLRYASLGREPFEERSEGEWTLSLVVPAKVFFRHAVGCLDGIEMKANFYKCGDGLQEPHFLSWNPIPVPSPDFHRPEYFGFLRFE